MTPDTARRAAFGTGVLALGCLAVIWFYLAEQLQVEMAHATQRAAVASPRAGDLASMIVVHDASSSLDAGPSPSVVVDASRSMAAHDASSSLDVGPSPSVVVDASRSMVAHDASPSLDAGPSPSITMIPSPPAPLHDSTLASLSVQVRFESGAERPNQEGLEALRRWAERLRAAPARRVRVCGHTDAVGAAARNLKLGQRRAEIIAQHLVQMGIPQARLRVESAGETEPLKRSSDPAALAMNRRVELTWLDEETQP